MRRVVAVAGFTISLLLGLALATLVILLATGTLKAYAIPSPAMEPTLHCARPGSGCLASQNDRVLVLTLAFYDRRDLVVFDAPPEAARKCGAGGTYVKRIVGLPDEGIELRPVAGRDQTFVNGEQLEEPYVLDPRRASRARAWVLSSGSYLVLGDNRANSCDSRVWGPLPTDDLKGKVVATYWPPGRITIR